MTPEITPLCVFGAQASSLVAHLLAERGVRFIGESDPQRVDRGGALVLASGETLEADRVVAATELRGPRITGLPADRWGFVTTDAFGSVVGLPDVYAVGDMTSFPVKQGGLAAQQADVVAQRIAAAFGVSVDEAADHRVLRARLLGGANPVFLRTELDEFGQATASTLHGEFNDSESDTGQRRSSGAISPRTSKRVRLTVSEHRVGHVGLRQARELPLAERQPVAPSPPRESACTTRSTSRSCRKAWIGSDSTSRAARSAFGHAPASSSVVACAPANSGSINDVPRGFHLVASLRYLAVYAHC